MRTTLRWKCLSLRFAASATVTRQSALSIATTLKSHLMPTPYSVAADLWSGLVVVPCRVSLHARQVARLMGLAPVSRAQAQSQLLGMITVSPEADLGLRIMSSPISGREC